MRAAGSIDGSGGGRPGEPPAPAGVAALPAARVRRRVLAPRAGRRISMRLPPLNVGNTSVNTQQNSLTTHTIAHASARSRRSAKTKPAAASFDQLLVNQRRLGSSVSLHDFFVLQRVLPLGAFPNELSRRQPWGHKSRGSTPVAQPNPIHRE